MAQLTDRTALHRNRARARARPTGPALFLRERVAVETQERLSEVNRTFTNRTIVTPWARIWAKLMPNARIVADDELLDIVPETQDLVIHDLCLHWAEDPIGQLVQCRRALRADGLLIATLFGGRTLHELRACLAEAESAISGGLSPRILPMAELRDLGGLLQRAGFALPVADTAGFTVHYETPFHLMRDLRAMGEGNALADRLRYPTGRRVLTEAAQLYSDNFAGDDGRVPASFEVVTLTGWAPDASQQQPLAPGSAQVSLTQVLPTKD